MTVPSGFTIFSMEVEESADSGRRPVDLRSSDSNICPADDAVFVVPPPWATIFIMHDDIADEDEDEP